jgi:hypothetical protein
VSQPGILCGFRSGEGAASEGVRRGGDGVDLGVPFQEFRHGAATALLPEIALCTPGRDFFRPADARAS